MGNNHRYKESGYVSVWLFAIKVSQSKPITKSLINIIYIY